MTVRAAVVVFPGTNCERDCARVLQRLGATVELLWHTERDLHGAEGEPKASRSGRETLDAPVAAAVR